MAINTCVKCGGTDYEMRYIDAVEGHIILRGGEYINTKDMLALSCQGCGYTWYREPLDKKEE